MQPGRCSPARRAAARHASGCPAPRPPPCRPPASARPIGRIGPGARHHAGALRRRAGVGDGDALGDLGDDAMPLASSTARSAASSFSPSVSSRASWRGLQPMFVDLDQQRRRRLRPSGHSASCGEARHDTAAACRRRPREGKRPRGWGRRRAGAPRCPACRAGNAACGYAPGRASPASRCAPAHALPGAKTMLIRAPRAACSSASVITPLRSRLSVIERIQRR